MTLLIILGLSAVSLYKLFPCIMSLHELIVSLGSICYLGEMVYNPHNHDYISQFFEPWEQTPLYTPLPETSAVNLYRITLPLTIYWTNALPLRLNPNTVN